MYQNYKLKLKKFYIPLIVLATLLLMTPMRYVAAADPSFGSYDLSATGVYNILTGLACYLTDIGMLLSVLAIAYAGLLYMTARGDSTQVTKAKKALGYAILGLATIVGVYVIIATVANAVGHSKISFFTCQREAIPVTSDPNVIFE